MGKALMTQALTSIPMGAPEELRPRARGGAGRVPVSSIMTRDVLYVRPDMSLESLTELLLRTGLSRVPVVDARGKVVGVVSKTDLVADKQRHADTSEPLSAALYLGGDSAFLQAGMHVEETGTTVQDIMTREVLVLPENATVAEAAELMATHHLHGIPVVSPAERLLGMVSSLDVLSWVAGLT